MEQSFTAQNVLLAVLNLHYLHKENDKGYDFLWNAFDIGIYFITY